MGFNVTNIGTAGQFATTSPLNITTGIIPAGNFIVVAVYENDISGPATPGTVTDTRGNTYSQPIAAKAPNNSSSLNGIASLWVAKVTTPLQSGDAISLALSQISLPEAVAMSACYVSGAAALDPAVYASATGNGSTPSVTSGTPTAPDLLMAMIAMYSNSGNTSFTQDSTHGWLAPLNFENFNFTFVKQGEGVGVAGGNLVSSNATIFAPTFAGSIPWAAFVIGFLPLAIPTLPRRSFFQSRSQ